jgi:hypothetical protein
MNLARVSVCGGVDGLTDLRAPSFSSAIQSGDEPTETPVKEPTTDPVDPDVTREPNTIPHRPAVPEPDVAPCERPDTSCPVHR